MKLIFEKYSPIILGLVSFIILRLLKIEEVTTSHFDSLISATLTITITIIGFIITVLAVLIGLMNTQVMRVLKKTNKISDFKMFILVPMVYGLGLIMVCILLLCKVGTDGKVSGLLFYLLVFFGAAFTVATVRLIIVLYLFFKKVIEHHFNEADKEVASDSEEDVKKGFYDNKR